MFVSIFLQARDLWRSALLIRFLDFSIYITSFFSFFYGQWNDLHARQLRKHLFFFRFSELPLTLTLWSKRVIERPLWSGTNKNRGVSTGPLACPFTRSLAPDYSLGSRPPLHSLVRSLPRSWESEFWCLKMTWFCPLVGWGREWH